MNLGNFGNLQATSILRNYYFYFFKYIKTTHLSGAKNENYNYSRNKINLP